MGKRRDTRPILSKLKIYVYQVNYTWKITAIISHQPLATRSPPPRPSSCQPGSIQNPTVSQNAIMSGRRSQDGRRNRVAYHKGKGSGEIVTFCRSHFRSLRRQSSRLTQRYHILMAQKLCPTSKYPFPHRTEKKPSSESNTLLQ